MYPRTGNVHTSRQNEKIPVPARNSIKVPEPLYRLLERSIIVYILDKCESIIVVVGIEDSGFENIPVL